MCIVSDKIIFCTCGSGSYEGLPHYWLLYRFTGQKDVVCMGEPIMPYDYLQPNFQLNKQTLAKRLNEQGAFDKKIEFQPNDQLKIVINNRSDDEVKRMTFCFRFKKNKWVGDKYDYFDLKNRYDELTFGNFDTLEKQ